MDYKNNIFILRNIHKENNLAKLGFSATNI